MDLRALIADQFGFLSPEDLPGLLLSMVLAGLGAAVVAWAHRAERQERRDLVVLAVVLALGAALTKVSLPLTVLLAAVVIAGALLAGELRTRPAFTHLTVLVLGFGCGIGASVIVFVALVPLVPLLRWASSKEK